MMKLDTTLTVFGIWLCFAIKDVQSLSLEAIVPRIEADNFQLKPMGQHYTLVIELPDGSRRMDNVELLAPNTPEEQLHFMGTITNLYPEGASITMYEAGQNGYTVKYGYLSFRPAPGTPALSLPASVLKSAAG